MTKSVLIVEDDFLIAYDLKVQPEDANYSISGPAGSIEDALGLIGSVSDVCVAVLDIDLHGESSFPIAEALMENEIPFLFLSGNNSWDLPAGLSEKIVHTKPVNMPRLIDQLKQLCPPCC